MPPKTKKVKKSTIQSRLSEKEARLSALHKAAMIMEKSRLEDYMSLVEKPWRMVWVNFLQGMSRGVGFFFGTLMLSVVLLLALAKFLGWIYEDVGGFPFFGAKIQEGIVWILVIIEKAETAQPGKGR
jgi:hypothetical protein